MMSTSSRSPGTSSPSRLASRQPILHNQTDTCCQREADAGTIAEERQFGTIEERQVLALELIADQLQLIAQHISGIGTGSLDARSRDVAIAKQDRQAGEMWDNEGGHFQPGPEDVGDSETTRG